MRLDLPPLTLNGGRVLQGGVLRDGAVSIADGKVVAPGAAGVDVRGYAVLPGAVDLGGQLEPAVPRAEAIGALATSAAMAGTTTLFVELTHTDTPSGASWPSANAGWPELRGRLLVDIHDPKGAEAMMARLDELHPGAVTFVHSKDGDRRPFATSTNGLGPIARGLAMLAAALDTRGIRYASDGDVTAETREWMSMIGARMVMRPATRQAAATARAMGEPVILSASDVLSGGTARRGMAAAFMGDGLCDALGSFGAPDAGLRAVVALVSSGRMSLGHAWALISSAPAGIMGLQDRGGLVVGTRADIVLLNQANLTVAATIAEGRLIYADADMLTRLEPVFSTDARAAE